MKILQVFSSCKFNGGASFSMTSLACKLNSRNDCDIIAIIPYSYSSKNEVKSRLLAGGVRVYSAPVPWWVVPNQSIIKSTKRQVVKRVVFWIQRLFNPVLELWVRRIIRQNDIDIVHICDGVVSLGAKAALIEKKPLVWHIREFVQEDHGWRFVNEKKARNLLSKSSKIIAVSDAVKAKFSSIINSPFSVVYNGVTIDDLSHERHANIDSSISFIMMGAVTEAKGALIAVEAIRLLRDEGITNIKLNLYGNHSSEYADKVATYIMDNNLENYVTINGFTNDINSVYRNSDALLMCSRCEAFGRVTAEAICRGLTVIGSASGGTTELLNKYGGILAKPNCADDFARAIKQFIMNRDYYSKKAGKMSKVASNDFSLDTYASNVYSIYSGLNQ